MPSALKRLIASRSAWSTCPPAALLALVAVRLVGDRHQPQRRPAIAFLACRRSQLVGREVCRDLDALRHGIPRISAFDGYRSITTRSAGISCRVTTTERYEKGPEGTISARVTASIRRRPSALSENRIVDGRAYRRDQHLRQPHSTGRGSAPGCRNVTGADGQ
jgi:hypothetical protein